MLQAVNKKATFFFTKNHFKKSNQNIIMKIRFKRKIYLNLSHNLC